jgi:regulator of nonsense transcripts 1
MLARIKEEDRVKYFAGYNSVSLGRVKNLFLHWARLKSPVSAECQQLNRLFSQCVDGNRIKIPAHLEACPNIYDAAQPFVLDSLHASAKTFIQQLSRGVKYIQGYSVDALQMLLCREQMAMSEFEMVRMTWTWCRHVGESFSILLPYFDFSLLTDEQKAWTIAQLPPERGLPELVSNGLLQSNIVTPKELENFRLEHPRLHWKCVFDGTRDRMANFLDAVSLASEMFVKKLIIFQVDERMALAMFLPKKLIQHKDSLVDDSVRVFAFPRSQSARSPFYTVKCTTVGYRLYCDSRNFQLFNNKRADTWVFLTRGPQNDSTWRDLPSQTQRRQRQQAALSNGTNFDCRASVAMNKISNAVQRHVGRVYRNGILGAVSSKAGGKSPETGCN